ncbi:glutaredoxin family protein [Methanobrevibacter sp. DSM 116169]|uniref:glutaredoxin family protein n=1 Tax=Methanobrevibacter sp. DSM 116169 TaxID=3242727 RepID=UPI0038FC7D9D
MKLEHVDGQNKGKVVLFALSTCGWCKKTRMLLEELEVEYDYVYVDLTEGEERDEVISELQKWNEDLSFPTMVINDDKVIIGFKEDEIKAEFA